MKLPAINREVFNRQFLHLETRQPERLSRQLREESGSFLSQRRGVIGLSLVATTALGVIGLYQMGLLKRLPDLPLKRFSGETVNSSPEAYSRLETPDAFLGLGSYAVTATLAAMGGPDRARRQPWIPLALAGKVALDTGLAVYQIVTQARKLHTYCVWCLLTSAATFATIPLVIPEARAALRNLLKKVSR